mgnify:CR=1 FL=1
MANTGNEVPLGLSDLDRVPLLERNQERFEQLQKTSLGPPPWRARKPQEVRDLLALEQIADRMTVLEIDSTTELNVLVRLLAPVPCMPPGAKDLVVADRVDLAVHYTEEILRSPVAGFSLVEILFPRHVHHPNVAGKGLPQRLWLGVIVPRGYPLREAVLASYAALSMQSVMVDEQDPGGVMTGEAALWWQANQHRIPLTTAPFLAPLRADRSDPCAGWCGSPRVSGRPSQRSSAFPRTGTVSRCATAPRCAGREAGCGWS